MKNKKLAWIIIGIISVVLIAISITYAYWQLTKGQEEDNAILSACLDISLVDAESGNTGITLQEQYPLSDEDGKVLKPYKFTVTNNCSEEFNYKINLELLGAAESSVQPTSVKLQLDSETPILLSKKDITDITINDAFEARALAIGTLAGKNKEGSSVTHELRLWIDEDAPITEAGKTFTSKISVTAGQGIINSLKKGTLAADLVDAYGGASKISAYTDELKLYKEADPAAETSASINLTTKYWYATDYTFNETTGKYSLAGVKIQATIEQCRSGEIYCGKYSLRNTSENGSTTYLYIITALTDPNKNDTTRLTYYKYKRQGVIAPTENGTGVSGMYKAEDDHGTSYYYQGDAVNNYVQFGSNASGEPMYWRVVRINGDGTIRLLYDGTELAQNDMSAEVVIDNTDYANVNSVDYKDSLVKGILDKWYEDNLKNKYDGYISDSIFCNDKNIVYEEEVGTEHHYIKYAPDGRMDTNPTLKCTREEDRYTVENGDLAYPIGLITADEIAFAGGQTSDLVHMYMYRATNFWTMTPGSYTAYGDPVGVNTFVYSFYMDHISQYNGIYGDFGVRPVINLKADVEFTSASAVGPGSWDNPYVIITN